MSFNQNQQNAAFGNMHNTPQKTTPVKYLELEDSDDGILLAPSAQAARDAARAARSDPRTPRNDSGPSYYPQEQYGSVSRKGRQAEAPYGFVPLGPEMHSRMFPGDARLDSMTNESNDPFVTKEDRIGMDKKLSPEAPAFSPITFGIPTRTIDSNGVAITNDASTRLPSVNIASPSSSRVPAETPPPSEQFSTDTLTTRVLKLTSIYSEVKGDEVEDTFSRQKATLSGSRQKIRAGASMLIRYHDLRDSEDAYMYIKANRLEWQVEYTHPNAIRGMRTGAKMISKHEGQICMSAALPAGVVYNKQDLKQKFVRLLETCGPLKALQVQLGTGAEVFKLVGEFFNIEAAKWAVESLNGVKNYGFTIEVCMNAPDLVALPMTPPNAKGSSEESGVTDGMARLGFANNPQIHGSGYATLTPTTRPFLHSGNHDTPQVAMETPYQADLYQSTPSYGVNGNQMAYFTPPAYFTPGQYNNGYTPSYSGGVGPLAARMSYTCPTTSYRTPWNGTSTPLTGPRTHGVYQDRGIAGYHPTMTPSHTVPYRRRPVNMRSGDAHANPSHNVVDLEKIRHGLDVRTTIMLRNIPNKIDQVMLKSIVDETSFGKYDFMYLRIDFANNCNVGYAFLNFEDPLDIIDFVNARAGQRWNRFNSDKVAEVSYATIQGKDCLVQKFRNSSVMLEEPAFRPKIFYTQGHKLAGQEEEFAKPDNPSKMRRSVENAEHVGLYAPRAGQHYRDEQRRRRSQYDRGTRLAELEENGFSNSPMPLYLPMGNHAMPQQYAIPQYIPQYEVPQYGRPPYALEEMGDGIQYGNTQQWMASSPNTAGPMMRASWGYTRYEPEN